MDMCHLPVGSTLCMKLLDHKNPVDAACESSVSPDPDLEQVVDLMSKLPRALKRLSTLPSLPDAPSDPPLPILIGSTLMTPPALEEKSHCVCICKSKTAFCCVGSCEC